MHEPAADDPRLAAALLPATVFHLVEADNRPLIARHGLLPASTLITRSGLDAAARRRLEFEQRMAHTRLPSGAHLRDQKPMPATALAQCLVGMSPAQWYAHINAHVFFWFDHERMNRHRAASEPRAQVVLLFDTAALLRACRGRVFVTPINTGNARRKPACRGRATFVAYERWCEDRWMSEAEALGTARRPWSHRPVELAVRGAVPHPERFLVAEVALPSGTSFRPQ